MALRSIVFIRHGEPYPYRADESDHARKLTEKGREQVKNVALQLLGYNFIPELIYCSDAVRALETLASYKEAVQQAKTQVNSIKQVIVEKKLYHATADDLFHCLYALDDNINSVLFIGHNPTWSTFSSSRSKDAINLRHANAAYFVADIEAWSDCHIAWKLEQHIKPTTHKLT
ncbi:MAG: histidine phosphatase family protein [Bdellovibrionota bacterium]